MHDAMMLWYFPIAVVLLLIAACLTIHWFRRERYSGSNLLVITCLVVLSITMLRMPLKQVQGLDGFSSFGHSLVSALQTIGLNEDLTAVINEGVDIIDAAPASNARPAADSTTAELFRKNLANASCAARWYAGFAIFQYAAAVGLCGFALIKTISSLLLRWQLKIWRHPVFFFSRLTVESIHLAHSIQQSMQARKKRALFCFTSVPEDMNDELAQAWHEAGLSRAFQLSESLNVGLFPRFSSRVNCILCSEDEEDNIKALARLLEDNSKARTSSNQVMKYFVYAQSDQAEQAIDALAGKFIPGSARSRNQIICMLNHLENLVMHILDQAPLHAFTAPDADNKRRLNILVAGSTPLAVRFLRNAYACGQMENCTLSITLADPRAEEVRQQLLISAPLLAQRELPIVQACGEVNFRTLSSRAAVADDTLLQDMQYILLAYDSDDENLKAARRIRTLIERQRLLNPDRAAQDVAIVYVVKDSAMNALCREIDPAAGYGTAKACRMFPVGSIEHQHRTETLFEDDLLVKAFLLDRVYNGKMTVQKDPDSLKALQKEFVAFMNKAYDRRSTVATTLHLKYRETILNDSSLSEAEKLQALAHAEHLRWNAYMIISGYAPPTDEQLESYYFTGDATHRSKLLKLHPCMVPSAKEPTPDLWAPGTVPADPLDGVSLKLHAMALKRLHTYLPQTLPQQPTPQDKPAIIQAAEALPEGPAREQAVRLAGALFKDIKQYDMDIAASTPDILKNASDPDIQAALRLFWLEVDT